MDDGRDIVSDQNEKYTEITISFRVNIYIKMTVVISEILIEHLTYLNVLKGAQFYILQWH